MDKEREGKDARGAIFEAFGPDRHLTPKQIALVHVAKERLGLDETEYRDLLEAAAGVRSARDLDQESFSALMAQLKGLGFQAHPRTPDAVMATPAQVSYIRTLWAHWLGDREDPYERGLRAWLNRRFGIANFRQLDREMAHASLVALKAMNRRKENRRKKRDHWE